MGLHTTIPPTFFEFLSCLFTVFLLTFLAFVMPIEQSTSSCNFEKDHFTWMTSVKVDGGINERIIEGLRNWEITFLIGHLR